MFNDNNGAEDDPKSNDWAFLQPTSTECVMKDTLEGNYSLRV